MGLRDLASKLALSAVNNIAGDISILVVYRQKTIAAYDPVSDSYGHSVTDTTVKAVETKEKRDEDDNSRVIEDTVRLLIPALSLPFEPKDSDEVLINTVPHEIVQVKTDPARALWIISARKP